MTSAAPPTARVPRCTKCQSFEKPSTLEYWHIGETTMRFCSVRERSDSGSKRCDIPLDYMVEMQHEATWSQHEAVGSWTSRRRRATLTHRAGPSASAFPTRSFISGS